LKKGFRVFAIKNYGLLWERKYIYYGWSGVSGHLRGYRRGVPNADFRQQSGVYILYDKDFNPVYVGQAGRGNANLFERLRTHETDHLWNRWHFFSWFGLCKVNIDGSLSRTDKPDRFIRGKVADALNDIEGVLILGIEPHLNKQGPRFSGVLKFEQYIDPHVEEKTLNDIEDNQERIESRLERIELILETLQREENKK
jgi:hypothetical protein